MKAFHQNMNALIRTRVTWQEYSIEIDCDISALGTLWTSWNQAMETIVLASKNEIITFFTIFHKEKNV